MDLSRDDNVLIAELRALRPAPRPEFAAELDGRAAAGFAADEEAVGRRRALGRWLEELSLRRALVPAASAAVLAIVVATAVVSVTERGGSNGGPAVGAGPATGGSLAQGRPQPARAASGNAAAGATAKAGAGSGVQFEAAPSIASAHRDIERGAALVLQAPPEEVAADAGKVFEAVHAAGGIVLSSSVNQWRGEGGGGGEHSGQAIASFQLLIPAARLDDTLAVLSRIAVVRSRHDSTADITAQTAAIGARLREARARIDGLLSRLRAAASEEERLLIEARLRRERRAAASLRSALAHLQRRVSYAHLSLRIEAGEAGEQEGAGHWGIDDALRDAGRILSTAGGVTVLALAVLTPLALVALLAMLGARAWTRRSRERALG